MRKTVILLDLGSEEVSREVTDYMGEYEYKNKVLSRIHNTEGAAVRQSNGSFLYEYTLKDHLGNTRVTFSDVNGDLSINPDNEVSQINHYAPFGLNLEGNWNGQNGANKVQYNGKEWNDDFGLGWNDYGARFYDPAMARWLAVDPLAEKYNHWSPYNYGMDSPIVNIDPDGRSAMPGRETNESEDYNNRPTVAELISKAERSNGHWSANGEQQPTGSGLTGNYIFDANGKFIKFLGTQQAVKLIVGLHITQRIE